MTTFSGGTAISGGGTPNTCAERRSDPFRLNLITDFTCPIHDGCPCVLTVFGVHVTDFHPIYVPTSTPALSANPAIVVPLLTINGWILMQRMATGSSVSFKQNWVEYRDGFGSPSGNNNYWLGLEKIYRLLQYGNVRLRIEVKSACRVTDVKASTPDNP